MADLEGPMTAMRNAWLAGRSALDFCPEDWKDALGEGLGREAALCALVGHAAAIGFRLAPAEALTPRPPLPLLALPTIPERERARVRRILAAQKGAFARGLLALMETRGFTAHPADWMPPASDAECVPAVYAPWLAWTAREPVAAREDLLTAETWDEWPTSQRRLALAELRAKDPDAARALLEARAGGEPAERRARLIELIEVRLSEADAPYLEQLAQQDRSDRIKTISRRLLARLGRLEDETALRDELAAMLELQGILGPRRLVVRKLKTGAQSARRVELFGLVSLAGLASALGKEAIDLVKAAPVGPPEGVAAFVRCVAETGSDEARRALLGAILADHEVEIMLAAPLAERLDTDDLAAALPQIVRRDATAAFETTFEFARRAVGRLNAAAIEAAPAYTSLIARLAEQARGVDQDRVTLERALAHLGLLASASAARVILDQCVAAGLSPADPRLDLLHLNAALTSEQTP